MTSGVCHRMLGMVAIGQSPRDEVIPQMLPFLPAGLAIRQVDAVDSQTYEQNGRLSAARGLSTPHSHRDRVIDLIHL